MTDKAQLETKLDGLNAEIDKLGEERKRLSEVYSQFISSYILMPQTNTYVLGVHALQEKVKTGKYPQHPLFILDDGTKIARPLTFKENIEAIVNDYNTLKDENGRNRTKEERLHLLKESWKDSCTGAAYKAKSTKFKIIPVCKELITMPKDFSKNFLPVDYDSVQETKLDSSKGKYNQLLPQKDVLEHEAWLAAVEGDKTVLKEYSDIIYSQLKQNAMGFYARQNTNTDELRAVVVHSLGGNSYASGFWDLDGSSRFLLVAHKNFFKGDEK